MIREHPAARSARPSCWSPTIWGVHAYYHRPPGHHVRRTCWSRRRAPPTCSCSAAAPLHPAPDRQPAADRRRGAEGGPLAAAHRTSPSRRPVAAFTRAARSAVERCRRETPALTSAGRRITASPALPSEGRRDGAPLLDLAHRVQDVRFGGLFARRRIAAVRDVDFSLVRRAARGIDASSASPGSGKTTLARMILGLGDVDERRAYVSWARISPPVGRVPRAGACWARAADLPEPVRGL